MNGILIAGKIKEFRAEHRLSQGAFGKLLGVSAQAVSKWERQVCFPDITLRPELSCVLDCDIADLFEISQTKCLKFS